MTGPDRTAQRPATVDTARGRATVVLVVVVALLPLAGTGIHWLRSDWGPHRTGLTQQQHAAGTLLIALAAGAVAAAVGLLVARTPGFRRTVLVVACVLLAVAWLFCLFGVDVVVVDPCACEGG
jgi:ABC-type Fe3+ transport system permease subunit